MPRDIDGWVPELRRAVSEVLEKDASSKPKLNLSRFQIGSSRWRRIRAALAISSAATIVSLAISYDGIKTFNEYQNAWKEVGSKARAIADQEYPESQAKNLADLRFRQEMWRMTFNQNNTLPPHLSSARDNLAYVESFLGPMALVVSLGAGAITIAKRWPEQNN